MVFTYNARILGPWTASATVMGIFKGYDELIAGETDRIAGIYAKDDKTVVFELNYPDYTMLTTCESNIFAKGHFAIIPAHLLDTGNWEDMESSEYWTHPIGTGPYKIEELSYPNYCVLTRNEDYFKDPAGIEKVLLTA